ncbi:hypothetical protein [Teredinibacter purpureus]|uniref:hypothetical protein n=1 Tax=Teredinibacter purpureus TaxID=2731756 RepID=UPI0005F76BE7|nr:hypothetical protein [Teredinibacter purpureus]
MRDAKHAEFLERKLSGETPSFKIVGTNKVTGHSVDYKLDRYSIPEAYCSERSAQCRCDELNKTAINGVWSPVLMSKGEVQKLYSS